MKKNLLAFASLIVVFFTYAQSPVRFVTDADGWTFVDCISSSTTVYTIVPSITFFVLFRIT